MPATPELIQREGSFLTPPGPARRNAELLFMLLPAVVLTIMARGLGAQDYHKNSLFFVLTLAAAFFGILTAPSPRRAFRELDWAVAGTVFWLLATFFNVYYGHFERWPNAALPSIGGGLCGLLAARPRWSALLAAPGLIPILVLGLMTVYSAPMSALNRMNLIPDAWMTYCALPFYWGEWGWATIPISLNFLLAGFGHAARPRSKFFLLVPWLVFGLAGSLSTLLAGIIEVGFNLAGLAAVAGLIAPYLAHSRRGLLGREAVIGLFIFLPNPLLFQLLPQAWLLSWPWLGAVAFIDPRPFAAVLAIALPNIWNYWRSRARRPEPSAPAPPSTPARARLICGHQGQAPRLAEWAGLESCRLASAHDDGFLLCPYGCLGLGDCARACPHGTIRLNGNGFPVIDESRCQGCGRCGEVCPKSLFELGEGEVRAFIPCVSAAPLKKNADYCPHGCLGCGRCRKACPAEAIDREGHAGAMRVDQAKCRAYGLSCGRACAVACLRRLFD